MPNNKAKSSANRCRRDYDWNKTTRNTVYHNHFLKNTMFSVKFQRRVDHSQELLQAINKAETMKLPSRQSYRTVRFAITTLLGLLVVSLTSLPCWAQQDTLEAPPQQETPLQEDTPEEVPHQEVPAKEEATQQEIIAPPFDVFTEPVDSIRLYL